MARCGLDSWKSWGSLFAVYVFTGLLAVSDKPTTALVMFGWMLALVTVGFLITVICLTVANRLGAPNWVQNVLAVAIPVIVVLLAFAYLIALSTPVVRFQYAF